MRNYKFSLFIFSLIITSGAVAQRILPDITVKNFGGKIIVSWQNAFATPVSNILIQRSYDSLKNYRTIGSVLNPQNKENGYADVNPPYTKMYYRVSVSFEGGNYIISSPVRPVKEIPVIPVIAVVDSLTFKNTDSLIKVETKETDSRYPWEVDSFSDSIVLIRPPKKEEEITYPSQRIFTARDNNIVIHLQDAPLKKYTAKFFDDTDVFLFELTKLNEEYLIIEKVNFVHTGWFHFEIYEDGKLIEKNKFQIIKDGKNGNR